MTLKIILTIAWRNIWRHSARSSVLLVAIAVGLWAGVFTVGTMNGMLQQRFDYLIENEVGHIQIHKPEFLEEYHPSDFIMETQRVEQWLNSQAEVKGWSGRVLAEGMLQSTVKTSGVRIRGIEKAKEVETTDFHENLISGSYLGGNERHPVLIGEKLANEHRLEIGHRLVLTFEDVNRGLVSASFNVVGVFRSASTDYDSSHVFVKSKDLSELLGVGKYYHEFAMRLTDQNDFEDVAIKLREGFPTLEVRTWRQVSPELGMLIDMGGLMLYVVTFIIMLALAFGILNTMLMALFERTKEIGVLLSIGMARGRIFMMMLLESFILTLVGASLGMLMASLSIWYLRPVGVSFEMFADGIAQLGWDHRVYPFLSFWEYIAILMVVVLVSFLASLYPAFRAMRLNPLEAEKIK